MKEQHKSKAPRNEWWFTVAREIKDKQKYYNDKKKYYIDEATIMYHNCRSDIRFMKLSIFQFGVKEEQDSKFSTKSFCKYENSNDGWHWFVV